MNIFRFFDTPDGAQPAVTTIPDTAMLIKQRPFFIPDFAEDACTVTLCAAVHITRLGRSIHEEFAHRYYNGEAVTVATHFVARGLYDRLRAAGLPVDIAVGFDDAVAVAGVGNLLAAKRAALTIGEVTMEATIDSTALQSEIDQRVAWLSQYYMLRQGDVLLLPFTGQPDRPVHIGDHLSLGMDGAEIWAFNVK